MVQGGNSPSRTGWEHFGKMESQHFCPLSLISPALSESDFSFQAFSTVNLQLWFCKLCNNLPNVETECSQSICHCLSFSQYVCAESILGEMSRVRNHFQCSQAGTQGKQGLQRHLLGTSPRLLKLCLKVLCFLTEVNWLCFCVSFSCCLCSG